MINSINFAYQWFRITPDMDYIQRIAVLNRKGYFCKKDLPVLENGILKIFFEWYYVGNNPDNPIFITNGTSVGEAGVIPLAIKDIANHYIALNSKVALVN